MLSIFATPKAFKGHFAIIQENAIESWTRLEPKCQIILLGNEPGTKEIAQKYNLEHVRDVSCNKFGTPLLPDIFKKAYEKAKFEVLMYVNCDIILTNDLLKTIGKVNKKFPSFFLTGSRWEFALNTRLRFRKDWEKRLRPKVVKGGSIKRKGPTDYFVFSPKINFKMPDFAVGRTYWDAWLIFRAKQLEIPIINATDFNFAVHQSHDYSHAGGWADVWTGPESRKNIKLIGDKRKYFNVLDADYNLMANGTLRPQELFLRLIRVIETAPVLRPKMSKFIYPFNYLVRGFRFAKYKARSALN